MALRFSVSAPGKVILSGEHSVVYGKPALAGVIGKRNTITLEATNKTHIVVEFDLVNEPWTIDIITYNEFLKVIHGEFAGKTLPEHIDHEDFLSKIKIFVDQNVSGAIASEKFSKARYAVFYLLTGILADAGCAELKYGFKLRLKSGITVGAGLGSSASFGVCLASAFYFYSLYRLTPNCIDQFNSSCVEDQSAVKNIISNWAFCSEKLMHGNPSGLDNTICTVGSLLKFYKGSKPIKVLLKMPLNVLLVNTRVDRSTVTLVQKVADLRIAHTDLVDHVLAAMGSLVEDIIRILEGATTDDLNYFKNIEQLVSFNNNLLRAIGVSHPVLEQIFTISEQCGFSSKLTGAGGGGYAIILLPPDYERLPQYKELCDRLTEKEFDWSATTIGGAGFEIVEHK